ncbi:MAG: sulfurtransferase-like selenium metabolism protein YedF [Bacteroidota bacterium]
MNTIDTKGLICPSPLIMLKEALLTIEPGESVSIITDNEISLQNMLNYLKDHGADPEVQTRGKIHTILTMRPDRSLGESDPAAYCETTPVESHRSDYVVCIKGDLMGEGDPELGRMLIETFIDNLKVQENLPSHVVIYNAGVKLAIKETTTCSSLNELEELGCRIMLCGNCIDFYKIQYKIGVGMISNMVSITETLASAGHVIYP